jgi:hypothetical protein
VRWVQAVSTAGTVKAKPQGGDTRSHRIEAFSGVILAAVAAQKDAALEIVGATPAVSSRQPS